ncbi:hypothetical protein Cme02nite_22800 [Catellatospora methionotrophica]|uniref:Uncharacterized protein n=1 Tax=Catellatospora methionotrophica TaxID=121620 RepID=A0A8J3L953_9ACTN|nr:hypothetical protein [Catellatospora methionotrophica]GIG13948.1 hypothetical protein Cme02nite_22800 [Catellatospora methionotrophica]
MKPEKSILGRVAIWFGVAGLVLLMISCGELLSADVGDRGQELALLMVSLFVLTWAVVLAVGEAVVRELKEQELTRRLLKDGKAA